MDLPGVGVLAKPSIRVHTMTCSIPLRRVVTLTVLTTALLLFASPVRTYAQRGQAGRGAATTAKAASPVDLTGYWVSVVSEDWRWRMVTPAKGDYQSVPLNPEGIKVAGTWDPAKDEADGNQCKAYSAAAIMRVPGRLHISWEDDATLRIDTDAGMQTRLLHFGGSEPPRGEPTWQGYSAAQWEFAGGGRGGQAQALGGDLKVITTRLRPGYLRKNGVPHSGNAVVTEYFNRTIEANGDSWLIVMTIVEDPQYLTRSFVTSTHFKKLMDAAGWNPKPCSSR